MSIHAANGNLAPAPGEYLLGRFAGKQWMKPPEVAELLGRGTQFVYELIEAGKLLAQAPEGAFRLSGRGDAVKRVFRALASHFTACLTARFQSSAVSALFGEKRGRRQSVLLPTPHSSTRHGFPSLVLFLATNKLT